MTEGTSADAGFPLSSSASNEDPSFEAEVTRHYGNQQEKLVLWQGIALLTADCMGVGILGLPNDMKLLGWAVGLSFLVLNCPINYYAGNLLSVLALDLERADDDLAVDEDDANVTEIELAASKQTAKSSIRRKFSNQRKSYRGLPQNQQDDETINQTTDGPDYDDEEEYDVVISSECAEINTDNVDAEDDLSEGVFQDEVIGDQEGFEDGAVAVFRGNNTNNHDRKTSDLINITAAIFAPVDSFTSRTYVILVKSIYYVNLFLVLGDYILVMSRSVTAFFGEENICLPTAGAIASILMFGLCQFRTMANLGRSVSLASLLALLIVLVQCLFHHRNNTGNTTDIPQTRYMQEGDSEDDDGIWGKFSSLAGIGFAVGSQKLFLNIRHELQHRDEASKVLAGSLFTYGIAYVAVVLLAGPDPPSFLFDAIPEGWGRKIAGLLLWFHVAVSYAINSQALCASLDHMLPSGGTSWYNQKSTATRWFAITLVVSLSSYIVSNAIPFFKDLVALIGALTSVPLSLTLPAILYRKARNIALLLPDRYCLSTDSYLLLLYSFGFLVIGLAGALSEIEEDWLSQGRPFACY